MFSSCQIHCKKRRDISFLSVPNAAQGCAKCGARLQCHAPIVLVNAKDVSGEPLVKGRQVTGFTNGEEEAVGLTHVVPHLVEDALQKCGGIYSKADIFTPYVCEDGQLITGQNPPSSVPTAEALMAWFTC